MTTPSQRKPLIGVTTAVRPREAGGILFCMTYTEILASLERAGALPVMIPSNVSDDTLRAIYERVDGVLLPGGGDIDPSCYGEERHPLTDQIDPMRDHAEITLARWAVGEDLPVFGICRGHQVVNVAMGGTLIQDIPSQVEGELLPHSIPDHMPRHEPVHTVRVQPSSRLASIVESAEISVNSIHHQAVRESAPGWVVTAISPDEIVEAQELPGKRFALTVQWHPEDLALEDSKMQALFNAFVAACAAN